MQQWTLYARVFLKMQQAKLFHTVYVSLQGLAIQVTDTQLFSKLVFSSQTKVTLFFFINCFYLKYDWGNINSVLPFGLSS